MALLWKAKSHHRRTSFVEEIWRQTAVTWLTSVDSDQNSEDLHIFGILEPHLAS
jgi:hypothetical protein